MLRQNLCLVFIPTRVPCLEVDARCLHRWHRSYHGFPNLSVHRLRRHVRAFHWCFANRFSCRFHLGYLHSHPHSGRGPGRRQRCHRLFPFHSSTTGCMGAADAATAKACTIGHVYGRSVVSNIVECLSTYVLYEAELSETRPLLTSSYSACASSIISLVYRTHYYTVGEDNTRLAVQLWATAYVIRQLLLCLTDSISI